MKLKNSMTRRDFLRYSALSGSAALLVACAPAAPGDSGESAPAEAPAEAPGSRYERPETGRHHGLGRTSGNCRSQSGRHRPDRALGDDHQHPQSTGGG